MNYPPNTADQQDAPAPKSQTWRCMNPSTGAPSGHPVFEQDVATGENPVCPICGSTSALQLSDPGNDKFVPVSGQPVATLRHEERLGTDQFGNPQVPQPINVDATALPVNQPGFDPDAAEKARQERIDAAAEQRDAAGADTAAQREAVEAQHADAAKAAQEAGVAPPHDAMPAQVAQPVFIPPAPVVEPASVAEAHSVEGDPPPPPSPPSPLD